MNDTPPGEPTELPDPVEAHRAAMRRYEHGPFELARNDLGEWTVNGDPDHPLALVRRWTRGAQ